MAGMFKRKGVYQAKYYVNGRAKYKSLRTRRVDVAKKRLAKLERTLEETGNPDRSHTSPCKPLMEQALAVDGEAAVRVGVTCVALGGTRPISGVGPTHGTRSGLEAV